MIANRVKELWAAGQCVANGWISTASPFTAEIMAAQGYDALTVDMQHGMVDFASTFAMMQAMRASGVVPMARVPWLDPAIIMQVLDAGAYGVICPMINTADQAAELVSYVRYPPHGVRSYGPNRAVWSAGANYWQEADGQMVCLAMIETEEAMANLDAILATPGLDGVYVGPADLTFNLTKGRLVPAFDRQEPEMIAAIRQIIDAAKKAGKAAGLHTGTADYAAMAANWGLDLVTLGNDIRLLTDAAQASLARFRGRERKLAVATY